MQQILCKFILNLPEQQIKDITRLSYHAQKAFYYYIDHVTGNHEEKECNQFYFKLKQYAPESIRIDPQRIATKLQENKPVCGAIIFNREQTKVLVIKVRGKYGFPKGKWNQNQTPEACAAREVQEETGIYIHHRIDPKIRIQFESHDSLTHFFVARGVGEEQRIKIDRKQIDGIIWMWIEDVRANIGRFVQKSRIAWSFYEKQATKKQISVEDFIKQYGSTSEQIQSEEIQNPFLCFRLNRERLKECLFLSGNIAA